jgi:hypothetical protein
VFLENEINEVLSTDVNKEFGMEPSDINSEALPHYPKVLPHTPPYKQINSEALTTTIVLRVNGVVQFSACAFGIT